MTRWGDKILAQHLAAQAIRSAAASAQMTSVKQAKPAKYRNEQVEVDGVKHDSGKEATRWGQLQLLQRTGEIRDLKRQVSFVLAPAVRLAGEPKKKPAIRYFADFTYLQNGQMIVEDVKSKPTRKLAAYRLKKHLMKTVHGLDITEI